MTANLQLTDIAGGVPREVDIEGATRVGNRIYWLASHSNAASGNLRPNRYRLFATDLSGSGSSATLGYVGRYDNLRTDLINWDTSNGHGKGNNYYGLSVSAATGIAPERDDGFNIEGFSLAPSGVAANTVYIGFRAPIVPTNLRSKALIVPVTNFASLVSGNPSVGPASFGVPIELDLGGRGIRSLECNDQGCLMVGGATAGGGNFRLFTWSGNPANAPVLRDADLTALNSDGSFEGIVELPTGAIGTWAAQQVQLAVDNGDTVYYNDAVAAKDLPQANFKKARTERINVGAAVSAPFVSIAISPSAGTEAAQTSLTITATAASAVSGNQTVTLGLSGAGVTNADFSGFSSTVTILSGQTSGSVSFNVADDALVEGAEVATFAITGTSAGLIAGAPVLGQPDDHRQRPQLLEHHLEPWRPCHHRLHHQRQPGFLFTGQPGSDLQWHGDLLHRQWLDWHRLPWRDRQPGERQRGPDALHCQRRHPLRNCDSQQRYQPEFHLDDLRGDWGGWQLRQPRSGQ